MKIIHVSDLHLGLRLHKFDLHEEQKDMLDQIANLAQSEKAGALIIAGDVFHTAMPDSESIDMLDDFLTKMAAMQVPVVMIAGNHDSASRVAYGGRLMERQGIHVAGRYKGSVPFVDIENEEGKKPVRIHLLPYLRPGDVKLVDPEVKPGWDAAFERALQDANLLEDAFNILVSHQFFAGGTTSESERATVGTLDQISTSLLEPFDYAALGHLHKAQNVSKGKGRYCGTLLRYSASELAGQKTFTVLDIDDEIKVNLIPFTPLRDFVTLEGTFEELMSPEFRKKHRTDNFLALSILDTCRTANAHEKLSEFYPRICKLDYPKLERKAVSSASGKGLDQLSDMEIFSKFFEEQSGHEMDDGLKEKLESMWLAIRSGADTQETGENYEAD